jgi:hypothetical protein
MPRVDEARVFRGIGLGRTAWRLGGLILQYGGGFTVLWALGLVVRGWQGWALLTAPLVGLLALRTWAWRRVSVAVAEGIVRYEGASPARDWEVPLPRVRGSYFDRALPGAPLVLALDDGDERACLELSRPASRRLQAHLRELGVAPWS